MPTRILRDYTDSAAFDGLSAEAERLFVRLVMKVDDFGRFHANLKLIKAACFPLAEDLHSSVVGQWLAELSKHGLVTCYVSGSGQYLALPKFRQRARASHSKFPAPDGHPTDWMPPEDGHLSGTCLTSDGQPSDKRPSSAHVFVFGDGDGGVVGQSALPKGCGRKKPTGYPSTESQAREMAIQGGANPDFAATFWNHFDGAGYYPQGNFVSAVKAKQGFKDADLADKKHAETEASLKLSNRIPTGV
jgi:hypothetical protein